MKIGKTWICSSQSIIKKSVSFEKVSKIQQIKDGEGGTKLSLDLISLHKAKYSIYKGTVLHTTAHLPQLLPSVRSCFPSFLRQVYFRKLSFPGIVRQILLLFDEKKTVLATWECQCSRDWCWCDCREKNNDGVNWLRVRITGSWLV